MRILLLIVLGVFVNVNCRRGDWKPYNVTDLPEKVFTDVMEQVGDKISEVVIDPSLFKNVDSLYCQIVAGKNCKMMVSFFMNYQKQQSVSFLIRFWWKLNNSVEIMGVEQIDVKVLQAIKGQWRQYDVNELPIDALNQAWTQYRIKTQSDSQVALNVDKIEQIWCQIVAGKKCKMTIDIGTDNQTRKVTLIFLIKLDRTTELIGIYDHQDLKMVYDQSVNKVDVVKAGGQ